MAGPELLRLEDHVHSLRGDGGSFVQFSNGWKSAPQSPTFLIGGLPEAVSCRFYSELDAGGVGLYTLKNALITVDGIITHLGKTLFTQAINHPEPHVSNIANIVHGRQGSLKTREIDGQAVLLTGPGSTVFGHWLVDFLPRLFVLDISGYDIRKLNYILPDKTPPWALSLIYECGISASQIVFHKAQEELLLVADLIIPTNVRQRSRANPLFRDAANFLADLIDKISPLPPSPINSGKIFISRRGADNSRVLVNRDEIESEAERAGFSIVRPETLTFPQQISLFRQADVLCGEYGSGLHGVIFSRPGTVVCAIRGSSQHPGWFQSGIGQVFGHPTGYLIGETPQEAVHQQFSISLRALHVGLDLCYLLSGKSEG
jgi:capsular polysaccharide biosynthesis protein